MDQKRILIEHFYFLHIPKTGGTFTSGWILPDIYDSLYQKNISKTEIIRGHDAWSPNITDSTYIMTILRDPAKRTVSHYAHHVKFIKDRKGDVPSFLNWLEEYKINLSNFQSRNIIFDKITKECEDCLDNNCNKEKKHWWFSNSLFESLNVDKDKVLNNLKRIDLILDNDYLKKVENRDKVKLKIANDLGLSLENKKRYVYPDPIVNEFSKHIYDSLEKKDIDYLYEMNNIDSEIYFSDIFTKI